MMIIDIVLVFVGIIFALVVGGIILAVILTSKYKKTNEIPSGIICPKCGCLNNTDYCGECGNKLR